MLYHLPPDAIVEIGSLLHDVMLLERHLREGPVAYAATKLMEPPRILLCGTADGG